MKSGDFMSKSRQKIKMWYTTHVICIWMILAESDSGIPLRRFPRIAGGHLLEISEMPFVVSLRYNKVYYCAGSIIGDQYILTAATCEKPEVERIKVRVGSSYYKKKGKTIRAGSFIPHPDFNNETLEKDVAVIVLQEPMNFTENIQPVLLPAAGTASPKKGELVTIAGWGYSDPNSDKNSSEEMRSVQLPILSRTTCQDWCPDRAITESMFCGGSFLGGKGPSMGDIGGPVVYKGIQVGVVSYAEDAGAYPLSPAVFTSVSRVRGFIQRYTKV